MVWELWKTVWWSLSEINMELPYDPAVLLVGMFLRGLKAGTQAGTCTRASTAPPVTVTRRWDGTRASAGEWIKHSVVQPCGGVLIQTDRGEALTHAATRTNSKNMPEKEARHRQIVCDPFCVC